MKKGQFSLQKEREVREGGIDCPLVVGQVCLTKGSRLIMKIERGCSFAGDEM